MDIWSIFLYLPNNLAAIPVKYIQTASKLPWFTNIYINDSYSIIVGPQELIFFQTHYKNIFTIYITRYGWKIDPTLLCYALIESCKHPIFIRFFSWTWQCTIFNCKNLRCTMQACHVCYRSIILNMPIYHIATIPHSLSSISTCCELFPRQRLNATRT